jgi:ankyrin repeat protein
MLDRDPSLVTATYKGAAATMLEAVAQPDVFGEHLGVELGVERRIVELLIERGSALDTPLNLAACFNRAELVSMLLAAGARADDTQIWGITPLQSAIYHGSREAADVLAAVAVVPDALYIAAGAGRVDLVARWFTDAGALKPDAFRLRPNLADIGWPPAPPPRDDPQEVLDEAFAFAAYNGRLEAMERLLARGASVDATAHLGMTALHFAVIRDRVDVARWLVAHGADVTRRDHIHNGTPLGWAQHNLAGSAIHTYLRGITPEQ